MPYLLLALRYVLLIILYVFIIRVFYLLVRDLQRQSVSFGIDMDNREREVSALTKATLVVVDSQVPKYQPGVKLFLSEVTTIGRDADNNLSIEDAFTSHRHAKIYWFNGNFWIEDLSSTNGSYVNGHRIAKETMLIDRDHIKVGSVTFQFVRWEHAVQ